MRGSNIKERMREVREIEVMRVGRVEGIDCVGDIIHVVGLWKEIGEIRRTKIAGIKPRERVIRMMEGWEEKDVDLV